MKTIIGWTWALFLRFILSFRYKITVKGLDKLDKNTLNREGGVLFLPNHPALFVDPVSASLSIFPNFPIRPMVVEYMYYYPIVNSLMRFMNALPVPDFDVSSNSLKRKKSEQILTEVMKGLKKGENFLIYPAGRIKLTAYEAIGGASGVHRILQETPEANVVLMRIKGLWGSKFSRALTGAKPQMFPVIWWGVKQVFKNLLFFTPKRHIIIELVPAPSDFPRNAGRMEFNQWLEKWYNQPDGLTEQIGQHPGDSLVLVPYSAWDKKVPEVILEEEPIDTKKKVDLSKVPLTVQEKIIAKIAMMTDNVPSSIKPEMSLSNDLGLDSLDTAELSLYIHDQFDIPAVPVKDLTTVGRVMGIAAKQIICKEPIKDEVNDMHKWYEPVQRVRREVPEGETIPEIVVENCKKFWKHAALGDARSGIVTYKDLLVRSIILAKHIAEMPGQNIGVLLPASVGAELCVLAIQLAGKTPVMINWTVGSRHLESVVNFSDPKFILSSWAFIDRLEGVDLSPIEDRLFLLEDLRRKVTLKDKIKGLLLAHKSTQTILNTLAPKRLTGEDRAVILFTSGTESMPKGVPLSHKNILSNIRTAVKDVPIYSDDILFGILPPFHTFGFSVSCLLPVLIGIKVAFYPDPTDGKGLARNFEKWRITIMCGAPTFIKGLLKAALPSQLTTMRLCVTGAEKAPPDLFEMLRAIGKDEGVLEGYGITECSPVLTMNRLDRKKKGVGQPLSNVELLVVQPETMEPVPPNTQGLILARGPNIFSGYLNPGLEPPFVTAQGKSWYKTGDLGDLDDDNYLTISGRLKRFLKVGPEMISLSAIEDALLQMAPKKGWPTSQEGPVLAVCAKEIQDEKPKILLFTKFPVTVDEVNRALRDAGFSNIIKVSAVQQIDDIPIMGTGKVNYRVLEQRFITHVPS